MYYQFESSWAHDLKRWTWAEDDRLICLRFHRHDRTFVFRDLYSDHPAIWNTIAQESIFINRQKSADDIEKRFFELLDGFLVYFNLSDRQQASQEKPCHYNQFTYFMTLCKLRNQNN